MSAGTVPDKDGSAVKEVPPSEKSLLGHRSFALFWSARVCTSVAYQMQSVAIGWLVYQLTGSAFDLGLVGLASSCLSRC